MPSMVLLMRSRLRMRPLSFSTRMPRRSWYWRLILRRPASSLGRSACSAPSEPTSSSKIRSPFLAFSFFGVRPIRPPAALARAFDVAAILVAHPEESLSAEPCEQRRATLGPATRTLVLRHATGLLRRLGLLLSHDYLPPSSTRLTHLDY